MLPFALGPTQMSPNLALFGLLGLGALLFALQRLRVRHRSRLVVTTLFWREALEESRARTLFERFRHPLTYLLLALIGGLLWLSVARFEGERNEGLSHVFLLDASATMGVGDRFDRAVDALADALEDAPRERTEVLLCGAAVTTLLAPGEDRALLSARLGAARPAGVPASVERAVVSAASFARRPGSDGRRFVVVGDAIVGEAARAVLREGDWIERLDADVVEVPGNLGITALGLAPARSGSFDAVDALLEVRGAGAGSAAVSLRLGADSVSVGQARVVSPGVVHYMARDLRVPPKGAAAETRVLRAELPGAAGDPLPFDNFAEVVLPELRLIRVLVTATGDPAADAALRAACSADPAIELVASAARADVVVGGALPEGIAPIPALTVASSAAQAHAILMVDPGAADPDVLLASALGELGLDRVDGSRLASELGRTLSMGSTKDGSTVRRVSLWGELFDPARCSFTESRAFPVVLGRTLRWLAATPELVPYQAIGRALPKRLVGTATAGVFPWNQARPGAHTPSLLDATATTRAGAGGTSEASNQSARAAGSGAGPWRFATWILAFVLVLLLVEWMLYQRGRIA